MPLRSNPPGNMADDAPPSDQPAETPPAAPGAQAAPLLEPGDYARYLLHSKSEILFVLRSLAEHVSQVTVFFNEGKDLLLTTVIAVADDALIIDYGASSEMNRKALVADKLFCVASLKKVRIQFLLRGLTQVSYEGRPAFQARLPTDLLRLQRREFFRLTMPITRPLKCAMPITDAAGEAQVVEVNVVDISGGGLAIALPDGVDFEDDQEFADCRIELPEVGAVTARVAIRNQFEITLRSGARVRRAGCEFVKLPGPAATLIQRYIIKVERERKARESGML